MVVLERACIRQAANELPEAPTWPDDVCLECASGCVGVCAPWATEDFDRLNTTRA